jgi:hypothetical protein
MKIRLWTLLLSVFFAASVFAADPILPDPHLTPGATVQVSIDAICTPHYTEAVRHVTAATKRKVFAEYGIDPANSREYEVDHLISLELGGSNDIKNLWPQSYKTKPWNARKKDVLENRLHHLVCERMITLEEAQRAIATNWIAAYQEYVGKN